jgi:hypothetical protein
MNKPLAPPNERLSEAMLGNANGKNDASINEKARI